MGKRVISLLVALVLIIGMIPIDAIPAFATNELPSKVVNANYGTVTVDGTLSEPEWALTGQLAAGVIFGAVYDADYLYLGFQGSVSGLGVKVNGTAATLSQTDSVTEVAISLSQVGLDLYSYDQTASLEITADGVSWTGNVRLVYDTMSAKVKDLAVGSGNRALKGNTTGSETDGSFAIELDSTGAKSQSDKYMRHLLQASSQTALAQSVSILEFDLNVQSMPQYPEAAVDKNGTNSYLLAPGVNMAVICDAKKGAGYVCAITNLEEKGLTMVIQHHNGTAYETASLVPLNKALNKQFHIRMEYSQADHTLKVYCDDTLVYSDIAKANVSRISSSGKNLVNINIEVKGEDYVNLGDVKVTLSEIKTGTLKSGSPLDNLTVSNILGSNEAAEAIQYDLPLPKAVNDPLLGSVDIQWKSSATSIMGDDGKLVPGITGQVTMTASLAKDPAVTKAFELTVSKEKPKVALEALLNTDGVTVDGVANETVWAKWTRCEVSAGSPSGSMAAAWNRGHIYLAMNTANANKLTLTIGEKTVNVDLAAGTADLADVAVSVKGGLLELDLPMAALGVQPTDYNDTVTFKAMLTGEGSAVTELEESLLRFTGKTVDIQNLANSSAGWTISGSNYAFSAAQTNAVHYIYTNKNGFSVDETTWISQDLKFIKMPVTSGAGIDSMSAAGYYYYASRKCEGSAGDTFKVCLYADTEGKLYANLLIKTETNATVPLGVKVGEEFRLTTAWNADGSIDMYVNGVYVGSSIGSCTYYYNGCGDNVLSLRYRSGPGNKNGDQVEFEAKNVTVIKTAYNSVLDELSVDRVLNRVDVDRVTGNLPMGTTYSSEYFENIPVEWKTSDISVIEANGTVHRSETAKTCDITLTAKGQELWTVKVTVAAASDKEQTSPAVYTTAFADDVVINGSIVGENWHMANRILADGQLIGEMGAAWNLRYLYIAVRNNGKAVVLTVKGKEINLSDATVLTAVSGNYTEIAIPMSYIDTTITNYGVKLPVSITVDGGTWEGNLILSSTDWWGAGNSEDPLPMLPTNVKSVARGDGVPDGNQGAKEVSNGWHLFDRYVEGGKNPEAIRTYILFMKTSPYENFANRDGTTTVEFDFQALSMPVYNIEEATTTMTPNAYACYGLNWHLSDAADSTKNSNLVYGGIFNTKDGLCLVTGGKNTYTDLLNKQLGDKFRVTLNWNTDDSLDVYIDGVLIRHAENQSTLEKEIGNTSFVVNMLRDLNQPKSAADTMDVYLTDIAFGTAYAENPMDTLTWENIQGENADKNNVTSRLELPEKLVNPQMNETYPLTWTSSDPSVVDPQTGNVTRPEKGAAAVTLTVTMENGSSKSFKLIVPGMSTESGNTLVVQNDVNPAVGEGKKMEIVLFDFDANNNSIIEDMLERKTINVVRLKDLDAYSRINRESLTLWISDDNKTYRQIEDYKLLHVGKYWYLYDFEATGRYVKVHYTHFDGTDADFKAPLDGIIHGMMDASLKPSNTAVVTAPATTLRDQTVKLTGLAKTDSLRIALEGKLLYHYVENGKVYVRIPEPSASGTALTVWNGSEEALELSNKEACYEITYGTRESVQLSISERKRWLLTVPAGEYDYGTIEKETLLAFERKVIYASYDGGLTWETYGTVDEDVYNSVGGSKISGDIGWIFDEETGAMFCIAHRTTKYGTLAESDAVNMVFASYDMGKTWKDVFVIEPDTVNEIPFNYMITYSGGIRVPSYDDTEGTGIDYVFPVGCQYTNSGGFCCRVAYTVDAGKTWKVSDSLLTFGEDQGNEAGLSEAWIMANESGTLVLYSRAQVVGLTNFVVAYSYDNGLTWTAYDTKEKWETNKTTEGNVIKCNVSSVYSANTQPLMFQYAQSNGIKAPVFVWAGNNALGCTTGIRTPLSVAVSYNGLETWRNIQNLFSETFMDVYTMAGRSMVVNQSVAQVNGDTLLVTFDRNYLKDKVWMTVSDFENFFYRTKGAYDDFESGNPFYEGWSAIDGESANVSTIASQGMQSLHIPENGIIARSIPYLQNGTIKLDVYVTGETHVTYALQPAVGTNPNANTLALITIDNKTVTAGNGSIALVDGWNTIEINLTLTEGKATLSANGGEEKPMALNLSTGDYVCYVTAFAETEVYMDEFYVVSDLDAVAYTGEICEHKYETEVTAPTCTEAGYTTHTCAICGESYVDNQTGGGALGHSYEAGTCTRCGVKEPADPEADKVPPTGDKTLVSLSAMTCVGMVCVMAFLFTKKKAFVDAINHMPEQKW